MYIYICIYVCTADAYCNTYSSSSSRAVLMVGRSNIRVLPIHFSSFRCVLQRDAVCCSVVQCVAVRTNTGCSQFSPPFSGMMHFVAVCCCVLLRVAVCCSCCSVLQCLAVCCSVLQCVAVSCSVCSVLLRVAVCCSVLQCLAVCCSVCSMLQCVAVRCSVSS